jgi:hypothetical protein
MNPIDTITGELWRKVATSKRHRQLIAELIANPLR